LTTPFGKLQPVAVEEVAEAFTESLDRPETFSQIINLGGPEKMNLLQLLRTFAAAMRRRRLFMSIPAVWVSIPVRLMERVLPAPPITSDQLAMLGEDNTCDTSVSERLFNIPRKRLIDGVIDLVQTGEIPG
jgi:NADH dehydrogenase